MTFRFAFFSLINNYGVVINMCFILFFLQQYSSISIFISRHVRWVLLKVTLIENSVELLIPQALSFVVLVYPLIRWNHSCVMIERTVSHRVSHIPNLIIQISIHRCIFCFFFDLSSCKLRIKTCMLRYRRDNI